MKKEFVMQTNSGNSVHLDIRYNEEYPVTKIFLFVHGFKGFKDWGFFPYAAEYFFHKGFSTINFNFSHSGVSFPGKELNNPEIFSCNTPVLEVEELKEIINALCNGNIYEIVPEEIILIGHSLGGAISLLCGKSCSKVNMIVTWASISKFDRYSKRQKEIWKTTGKWKIFTNNEGLEFYLKSDYLYSIEEFSESLLNIKNSVGALNKKLLILHGSQDKTVDLKEARELYSWSDTRFSRLEVIENTGHTFGISHPFNGTNKKFDEVLERTLKFIQENSVN